MIGRGNYSAGIQGRCIHGYSFLDLFVGWNETAQRSHPPNQQSRAHSGIRAIIRWNAQTLAAGLRGQGGAFRPISLEFAIIARIATFFDSAEGRFDCKYWFLMCNFANYFSGNVALS